MPAIPVHAAHGTAIMRFFPGDPLPRTHPAPLDLAWTALIRSYWFGPQRAMDSVHHGYVSAHVSAPTPAWCTAPISSRHVVAQSTAAVKAELFCVLAPLFSQIQPAVLISSN